MGRWCWAYRNHASCPQVRPEPFDRCRPVRHAGGSGPYDGVAELWADNLEEVKKAFAEPRYLEIVRSDEHKFLDLANCVFMVTEEVPMKG